MATQQIDVGGETGRKIDLLMKVTNTKNAQLARALNFDASYNSRIRSGKRGLPTGLPFIEPAAAFFARNVHEDYQAEALVREMGILGEWPDDQSKAASLIARWLEGAGGGSRPSVEGVSAATGTQEAGVAPAVMPGQYAEARLFFGNGGRREAALAFLGNVADAGEPRELLLQSDEDTAWMYEDHVFAGKWSNLMGRLVEIGCTFTVIHTVSRGGNEMWEGVREWLPLYLTGAIRPYYYPRLRDGVRMRSLFVARGKCALVSNSVQGMDGDALCIMLDDADAASVLACEFDTYLELCRPLVQIDYLKSSVDLGSFFEGFQNAEDAVAIEVSGSIICAQVGQGALIASPGENPVIYRIDEPRLADAIAGYVDQLPGKVSDSPGIGDLLGKLVG